MTYRIWIKTILYRVVLPVIAHLPKTWAYKIATKVGRRFFWRFEPEWVEAYRKGLVQLFPNTPQQIINSWVYEHFGMMGREMLDVFLLPRMTKTIAEQQIKLEAGALLDNTSDRGKILIMSHQGRPIMLSSMLGLNGHAVGMLSQAVDDRNPHLDSATKRYLQFKMTHTVRLSGGKWITTADHLRVIYQALKSGDTIIIMMDLVEADRQRQVDKRFMNGCLHLPPGILRLADKTGAKLYFGRALDAGQQVNAIISELDNDPEIALQQAVDLLAQDIEEAPWQWWQWHLMPVMWSKYET